MYLKRLEQRILKRMGEAVRDFGLIAPGDRILVAMSGGKDSYGLLWGLMKMRAAAPVDFDLVPYHLDQGQPGHDVVPLRGYLEGVGLPFEIELQDTYTRVVERTAPGKIYCALCSRYRRAILYRAASRLGCNKVALGHHRDDLIETLMLNLFYAGQLKSMPPRLVSQQGTEELIRPLAYVPEEELVELAAVKGFPILPCKLCGSQDAQRKFIKRLLAELSQHNRHLKGNLLNALRNVVPTHLLDARLNPLYPPPADALPTAVLDTDDDVEGCAPTPRFGHGGLPLLTLDTSSPTS